MLDASNETTTTTKISFGTTIAPTRGTDTVTTSKTERYPHLASVRSPELEKPDIDVIISTRHAHTWIASEVIFGGENDPILLMTKFGPALIGPSAEEDEEDESDRPEFRCLKGTCLEKEIEKKIDELHRHDFINSSDTDIDMIDETYQEERPETPPEPDFIPTERPQRKYLEVHEVIDRYGPVVRRIPIRPKQNITHAQENNTNRCRDSDTPKTEIFKRNHK